MSFKTKILKVPCLRYLLGIFVFFLPLLFNVAAVSTAEMVTDGNFPDVSNWTLTVTVNGSGSATCTEDTLTDNTGDSSSSVKLSESGKKNASTCTVVQTVSPAIASGTVVNTATLYKKLTTSHEITGDSITIDLDYALGGIETVLSTGELTDTSGSFTQSTNSPEVTLTDDVNQITITMNTQSGNNNGATADLWIDDVSITYTPSNATPVASQADITGADDPVYPGISYSITAKYSDADGATDLVDMFLQLNHDTATDIIWRVTESGATSSGNVAIDQGDSFLGSPAPTYSYTTSGNEITVTYTFVLDWDWTESPTDNIEYGVRATDSADDSGYSFTNIDVKYEKDLDFSGTVAVSGSIQGSLTDGVTWVQGSETLSWSGLTVVFEGSSTSPASDTDYDILITDDDDVTSTQTTGGPDLSLNTTADAVTDTSNVHDVDIINITPNGLDSSGNVQFTVKVDATDPVVASADDTALDTVDVVFTEDHSGLDPTSAGNKDNYTVYDESGACSGATTIGVSDASLSGNTVTLTLAANLETGKTYCVDVTGDRS
jgi:hypothetical protein